MHPCPTETIQHGACRKSHTNSYNLVFVSFCVLSCESQVGILLRHRAASRVPGALALRPLGSDASGPCSPIQFHRRIYRVLKWDSVSEPERKKRPYHFYH